jgi:origin recognition complex subunit 1
VRCRRHSPLLHQDAGLRKALGVSDSGSTGKSLASQGDWKSSFRNVIQKLSLTDASKEGFHSTRAIVGREKEMREIHSFLRNALKGSCKEGQRSLFIAGPPGVGKTACVRAAISELEHLRAKGKVPPFEFVFLNGMEMRFPFEAYVHLWERISGKSIGPDQAADRLESYFTKDDSAATREAISTATSVVVLLDEIDYLVTKNQSVLYNFFDWPTHNQDRRLIVLGVSNTLNLAEQLHTRVQSRIGGRRCIFKAYDAEQIQEILQSKLLQASPGYTVFDQDAIKFVSKKTASLSGDIRRAFQICRTSAEYVMREHASRVATDPVVSIRDAVKVSRESFHSAKSQAIVRCTAFEALLLVTLASLSKSTGREFGGFDLEEILVKMEALANGLGDVRYLPTPNLGECLGLVSRLAEGDIVSTMTPKSTSLTYRASSAGSGGPWPLVSLTVDDLSVLLALKKSPHHALAQKYLGLKGL